MANSPKEFHRPGNWSQAHQLLNRTEVHTVPYTISPRPTALQDYEAEAFVDLEKLQNSFIQVKENGHVHIGALTTLQDIYQSELIKTQAGGVLAEAAYLSATLGLRNLATVAGSISNPENPPDVPLVLLAFDAVLTVQKAENQTRMIPLHEWMKNCDHALQPGEVILEVSFASQEKTSGALARVSRTPRDKAIVAAVAVLLVENGVCSQVGLALAGVNPSVVRLFDAESLLIGQVLSNDLLDKAAALAEYQADPVGDYRGSLDYRTAMSAVLIRRALSSAIKTDLEAKQ